MKERGVAKVVRAQLPRGSVAELLAKISPKRQQRIRRVLEHPVGYVLFSVRKLATHLKMDPSTLLRTILAMGFSEYRDFQEYLHQLSISHATSLDLTQPAVVAKKTASAQIEAAIRQNQQNLRALSNGLDVKRTSSLGAKFFSVRRIIVFGSDSVEPLVRYLEYQLHALELPIVPATSAGSMIHVSRSASKKDLVIAISFRRGLRQTVEALKCARSAGAYCIGITDSSISPIARYSNEHFIVSIDTPFGTSYAAPMALLNAVICGAAFHRPHRTMILLQKFDKEQRTGYRWYQEE
ncbi:MAG: MurR/RpiR family transcriptional regulator [Candidatus Sulfotelmatobacter sp.]